MKGALCILIRLLQISYKYGILQLKLLNYKKIEFGWVGNLHTFLSPTMDLACIKLVGLTWECCIVLAAELREEWVFKSI